LAEYETVKVSRIVKSDLDRIKAELGLPSSSQTVTALIQRHKLKHDIIVEIKQDLAREASTIISNQIYRKIFKIFKQVDKPPSQVTLAGLMDILSKKNN
jgi:hypothetical protein